jgi:ferrous iron transport protein B
LRHMWDRSALFLKRAGTVILGISIILWFLASYPKVPATGSMDKGMNGLVKESAIQESNNPTIQSPEAAAGEQLRHSFAGRMGQVLEPIIKPLGYDWKMGIGIVASFAAREVCVSTMSTVYNVGQADDEEKGIADLAQNVREQQREDGTPAYTPLVAVSLMVFYVFALQCVSTVAVVRRETNSWRWPIFQWVYMGVLAWVLAFITYQGGKLLGF